MKELDIQRISIEHLSDSLALSQFAFQYELSAEKLEERRSQYNETENWGAYVDGKLAARMTILDLHTWLFGKRWAMGGIAGVATWPEYRRGGLVAGLLHNALHVMKEQGQTLSFLHPFQFAFYRKFGWETYTETKKYEIPTALLPKLPPQPGHVVRVGEDIELLNRIYSEYASRYNGSLDRDEAWWKRRIFANRKGSAAAYYDADGRASGYIHYQVKESVLQIHELVSLNWGAAKGLWRFIADHDSMIDKVTLNAPLDDQLPFVLDNPRIKQEIIPYFMARIVDVKPFLEQFPFAKGTSRNDGRLTMFVTDAHASWNNGLFVIEVDSDGNARIEAKELPAKEGNDEPICDLSCDISTLTAMFMGYRRPSFMNQIERLKGEEAAISHLEALIPYRTTYLPDFF
ncbi:GNAT family N-acetyltransferase [Paenibacillus radicis (ex Xue et al. 2023)]|uniref:GNAT family N-acetyltransferase n=1 Tax=Paenibacillus radicis (ex Xue et al. 2023) TaxID=2972489 RepID=A0ABT1YJ69_9BACL|nr:GNAT family N-acetyltransferase [Paenibacillus radicis (ex Xue et al. 2023)]MCR8633243.1 GNAT family N-acetyltransferase [Paenibacillus radicis (ex Xue et al. 2023)]